MTKYSSTRRYRMSLAALALLAALLITACGADADAANAPRVVPTQPSARFAMPTTMITPTPDQPTVASTGTPEAEEEAAAAATPEPTAAPAIDLNRGQTVFVNRNCAECHGEQGEGLPDKGATIAGTQLTLSEFTEWLRTGGKGVLGNDHIFGPTAISPGGMEALHAWLQSLPAPQ